MTQELDKETRRQKELRLYYVNNRLRDLSNELRNFHDERLRLMRELGKITTTMKD